ncbi:MAG TPA: DUF5703 domain-containing protein [Bryobacteraceae bacterium]|nr:DUF5703 domain-containing protein [Bryobacteraceae bacterium]
MRYFCFSSVGRAVILACAAASIYAQGILSVDYGKLAARADLQYEQPASRSEEGMPVGNGRMGSLVWSSPSALHFQINRADVFAENSSTVSFPRADTDYAGGCGYVDINLVQSGDDIFAGAAFHQTLSVDKGLMTVQGSGITARVLAWPERDVMAVEINDQRPQPEAVNIDLRMLRYLVSVINGKNWDLTKSHAVDVKTAEHSALSRLEIRSGRILLTQEFREGEFYDSSAVAIGVLGRPSKARYLNESTVQLSAAPSRGAFTILISSAATFNSADDAAGRALAELDAAAPLGFSGLLSATQSWWRDFWAKGFVHMHSEDGQADFVEQNYTYFLYLVASSSRGAYPPRFGGMLWYTNGDMRRWGSQYWWANTAAYYRNLMPAGRMELMEPLFSLYSGMYDACALAARQQWGSEGIWIPETTFFNGPEKLPDDIAAEMRDLYLARKPASQMSERFRWWSETENRHNSRWNFHGDGKWDHGHYIVADKGHGVFGHTSHILGGATRIASVYWDRYLDTQDAGWLRDRAYPMIKGAAEFYRNFPNLRKGADGKYHLEHVNNNESNWDTPDTRTEVSYMQMIFPLAAHASEILGVDANLRPLWRDIAANLPTLPPARGGNNSGGFGGFIFGNDTTGAIAPLGADRELKARFLNFNRTSGFIDVKGIGGAQIFRNRLRLREGPGAIDAEHIGGLASGIHSSLLANVAGVTEDPVLEVFSAWPSDWDAEFQLLAAGAFTVTSSRRHGKVEFVELSSRAGAPCRIRNPWGEGGATLYRNGKKSQELEGSLLTFSTARNENIVLVPRGVTPESLRRAIFP